MNAHRFLENSNSATGDKIALSKPDSPVTVTRKKGFATIKKIASAKGDSVTDVATQILGGAPAELARYIQAKGLVPSGQVNQMIAQAALLRLKDIGQTGLMFNTTDAESLKELEEAESLAFQTNSADADNVLPPQAQAALLVVIDEILKKSKKANGIGNAKDFVKGLSGNDKGTGDYNPNFNINNLLLKGAANNATGDTVFDIGAATSGTGQTSSAGSTFSLMDWINTAVASFSTIVEAFKKGSKDIADSVVNVKDTVQGGASDIGAESLDKFFAKNKWYFIGGLFLIILVILIAVYAKRK